MLTTMSEDSVFCREEFSLDEEIAEGRMGSVGLWSCENDLSVTRQLDFSGA